MEMNDETKLLRQNRIDHLKKSFPDVNSITNGLQHMLKHAEYTL